MSFGGSFKRFRKKAIPITDEARKAATIELFNSTILDTPVDRGRARANWQVSESHPVVRVTDDRNADPTAKVTEAVNASGYDETMYLTNNLPYAEELEFGSSKQAPAGMMRKNFARVKRLLEKHARQNRI